MAGLKLKVEVDTSDIDEAIEKVEELKKSYEELLYLKQEFIRKNTHELGGNTIVYKVY